MTARRPYHSPLRTESADRTRSRIVEHATELFATRGYGRVTVADIATAAGISSKTVFSSLGSKSEVLRQIADGAVGASGHRRTVAEALALDTADDVVSVLAHGTRIGNQTQFRGTEVLLKAMPVHEEAEQLWRAMTGEYRSALADIAAHLISLDPALTNLRVEDLLWFCFGPTAWRTLVVEGGFDWDRAEVTLANAARGALWPSATTVSPARP